MARVATQDHARRRVVYPKDRPTTRMLVVASREDKETWTTSKRMADLAKADPHVSAMWIAHGGHNYNTYVPHLGEMIQWAFTQPQT